jgi:replicative DNA helicase
LLYLDDNASVTVMEIRAKARRLKAKHNGLGLIVIDYLQLMSGNSGESRQLEVSEISRNLKILARELEVPVIALSQLSRRLEDRQDKRPQLSDLRESGSLEQDADIVMFLHRPEMFRNERGDGAENAEKGVAEVIVGKHRAGPTGTVKLVFFGEHTRFENMAKGFQADPDPSER